MSPGLPSRRRRSGAPSSAATVAAPYSKPAGRHPRMEVNLFTETPEFPRCPSSTTTTTEDLTPPTLFTNFIHNLTFLPRQHGGQVYSGHIWHPRVQPTSRTPTSTHHIPRRTRNNSSPSVAMSVLQLSNTLQRLRAPSQPSNITPDSCPTCSPARNPLLLS